MYKLYNYDDDRIRINNNDKDIRFYSKADLSVYAENGQLIVGEVTIPFQEITVPDFETLEEYVVEIQSWIDEYEAPEIIPTYETVLTKFADSVNLDSFGRLRVSENGDRFDAEFNYDLQEELFDKIENGNGTITHDADKRHALLSVVATGTGDGAVLSSYPIPYTPGCSQFISITGVLNYASISGGTAFIFLRSSVSGTAVTTLVPQSEWDYPNTDISWDKSQIFELDFQSLKVGRIRYMINRDGIITCLHEIKNDNRRNTGYWQTPNLPVCYRIYNDATYTYMEIGYGNESNGIGFCYRIPINASATMTGICATVKSEGGNDLFDIPAFNRVADRGTTTKTISTSLVPLISIRPRSTFNSIPNLGIYIPLSFTIQTDNPIKLIVIHDCLLTNASWNNVDTTQSGMEYDIAATAYTNGHIVHSEYVATSKNSLEDQSGILGRNVLWDRQGDESGILTIAAIRTSGTDASVLASFKWSEIR
jgi:hypothetical protein